jgi:hypothetical protein
MKLLAGHIDRLKAELATIPALDAARREVSKQEAIRRLAPEIENLRRRGYRLVDVVALLSKQGIAISPATLSSYLARAATNPHARTPQEGVGSTPGRGDESPSAKIRSCRPDSGQPVACNGAPA